MQLKTAAKCLLAMGLAVPGAAMALPVFSGSVGVYGWHQNPSGHITYEGGTPIGSDVYLKQDLGIGSGTSALLHATLNNSLPLVPNLSLSYSDFDQSGTNTLNRTIVFGGNAYPVETRVYGRLELREFSFTLFYRPIERPFTLRLGLTGDNIYIKGTVKDLTTAETATASGSTTIPAAYAGVTVPLPLGFSASADGAWVGYGGTHFDRWQIAAAWTSIFGAGVRAGYRKESFNVSSHLDPHGDISFSGAFAGVFYRF